MLFSDAEIAAVSLPLLAVKAPKKSRERRSSGNSSSSSRSKRRSARFAAAVCGAGGGGSVLPASMRVTLINVDADGSGGVELVECQLETAHHASVSFKFSRFTDHLDDIAATLVRLHAERVVRRGQSCAHTTSLLSLTPPLFCVVVLSLTTFVLQGRAHWSLVLKHCMVYVDRWSRNTSITSRCLRLWNKSRKWWIWFVITRVPRLRSQRKVFRFTSAQRLRR